MTLRCETNELSETQNSFLTGIKLNFSLSVQISQVLNLISGALFLVFFIKQASKLFLHTAKLLQINGKCGFRKEAVFIVAAACGFAEQKNLTKSVMSMRDCFLPINHVTPFRLISARSVISATCKHQTTIL